MAVGAGDSRALRWGDPRDDGVVRPGRPTPEQACQEAHLRFQCKGAKLPHHPHSQAWKDCLKGSGGGLI